MVIHMQSFLIKLNSELCLKQQEIRICIYFCIVPILLDVSKESDLYLFKEDCYVLVRVGPLMCEQIRLVKGGQQVRKLKNWEMDYQNNYLLYKLMNTR